MDRLGLTSRARSRDDAERRLGLLMPRSRSAHAVAGWTGAAALAIFASGLVAAAVHDDAAPLRVQIARPEPATTSTAPSPTASNPASSTTTTAVAATADILTTQRPTTTARPATTKPPQPKRSLPASTTTAPPSPTHAGIRDPVWSAPSDCEGTYDVDITTGAGRRITGPTRQPVWSPDGTRLAFNVFENDAASDTIAVVEADGSNLRAVRVGDRAIYQGVHWHPGTRDIWAREAYPARSEPTPDQLLRINTDTGAVTAVRGEGLPDHQSMQFPLVSPRGDRIAFGDGIRIFTMDVDGSDVVQVADGLQYPYDFRWSPDGTTIAVDSGQPEPGLYFVAANGTGGRRVVATSHEALQRTGWSPDGALFAFTRDRHGQGTVEVIAADGSDHRALAAGRAVGWSPDGEWLALGAEPVHRGGAYSRQIHVIRRNGSGQRVVIEDPHFRRVYAISWSPHGRLLVLCG